MKLTFQVAAFVAGISLIFPVDARSDQTTREVWIVAKSHYDLPSSSQLQNDSNFRPKVIIASAHAPYALNHEVSSADGIYFQADQIVLSEDGDSIVGGITDDITFSFSYFTAVNNNHFYSFSQVTDDIFNASRFVINMNEKVLWFSNSQEMSWDVEFLDEDSGKCNIMAMTTGGSKLGSSYYPYLKYKADAKTFTNDSGANSTTSEEYALRLYVSRTEIVQEPPRAPEIYVDGYGQIFDGHSIDLSESANPRYVIISSREGVSSYFRFTENGAKESEFQKYDSAIEVSKAGHLDFYAQNDDTELKSAIQTIYFTGVLASEAEAPDAPELYLGDNELIANGQTVNLSEKVGSQYVSISAAEGINVFYRYIKQTDSTEPGYELYTMPVEIATAGLIDFYAEDPKTELRSDTQTVYFTGEPVSDGIADIRLTDGEVGYYDILGRPVSSPASFKGILLLRTATGIEKIKR